MPAAPWGGTTVKVMCMKRVLVWLLSLLLISLVALLTLKNAHWVTLHGFMGMSVQLPLVLLLLLALLLGVGLGLGSMLLVVWRLRRELIRLKRARRVEQKAPVLQAPTLSDSFFEPD